MRKIAFLVMLMMALIFSGCADKQSPQEQPKAQEPQPDKVKVVLYFANENADALIPVEREIEKPKDMVAALINELKNPPNKVAPVLPEGTELQSQEAQGDTLVLNFNQAFANLQGSTGEFITINSVVNTLTELPEYKAVKFLVEDQPLETGHAIYDQPVPRNESVIQK